MSRVLCIDDEPAILRLLAVILQRDGHEAIPATDGHTAFAVLKAGEVDAVLLDLGLPDRDGLELLARIRLAWNLPVLVVSARAEVSEKVAALDLGAADYITKPFDGDELLARLRVALRAANYATAHDSVLCHGAIRLDAGHHTVEVAGRPVGLTPKEFAVLKALVGAGGRILTHRAILEAVWGKAHSHDVEYLRVVIRALRRKIEDNPAQPRLIRNEPGIGYRVA